MMATLASGAQPARSARPRLPAINGTVSSVQGQQLTIHSAEHGDVTVSLATDTRIIDQEPSSLEEVKAGRFIGTTAIQRSDGQLHATEIHIFPESMRGAGEGHYPMGAPNTTMTNGNIEAVNGSVGATGGAGGHGPLKLTITYHGGQTQVDVPPGVTVTRMSAGSPALLVPGAHVTVLPQRAEGSGVRAAAVIVHGGHAVSE
jgi:hypothetical protein